MNADERRLIPSYAVPGVETVCVDPNISKSSTSTIHGGKYRVLFVFFATTILCNQKELREKQIIIIIFFNNNP